MSINTINENSLGHKAIYGTDGDDSVNFTLMNDGTTDAISTGAGNDILVVSNGPLVGVADKLIASLGDGNDLFSSSASMYTLNLDAGTGNDTITFDGSVYASTLSGGAGNDVITDQSRSFTTGNGISSLIDGGTGNDTIDTYSDGHKAIYGGDGNDLITLHLTNDVVTDAIDAGDGNDQVILKDLTTNNPQDRVIVSLGNGNDIFENDATVNSLSLDAGTGNDTIYIAQTVMYATISGGLGNDLIINTDTGTGGTLMAAGRALIDGGSGDDTISATSNGYKAIYGGDGNDNVVFQLANDGTKDFINAEAGNDTVAVYGNGQVTSDVLAVSLGDGDDVFSVENNAGLKSLTVDGGDGNDTISAGNGGNETLMGGKGNDQLYGGKGDDSMAGGDGNDLFYVGAGKDTIDGGTGTNGVTYFYDTKDVNVNLMTGVDQKGDVLTNISNVVGGSGNDMLVGNNSGNLLNGYLGNDFIVGGAGNDYIDGGDGNDTIHSGMGSDTLIGGAGNDKLFSLDGIGNSYLSGGTGNDTLYGGSGNETLIGGAGNDQLVGGGGADLFVVLLSNAGETDIISDFTHGEDHINIVGASFAHLSFTSYFGGTMISDTSLVGDHSGHIFVASVDPNTLTPSDFIF